MIHLIRNLQRFWFPLLSGRGVGKQDGQFWIPRQSFWHPPFGIHQPAVPIPSAVITFFTSSIIDPHFPNLSGWIFCIGIFLCQWNMLCIVNLSSAFATLPFRVIFWDTASTINNVLMISIEILIFRHHRHAILYTIHRRPTFRALVWLFYWFIPFLHPFKL